MHIFNITESSLELYMSFRPAACHTELNVLSPLVQISNWTSYSFQIQKAYDRNSR